MEAQILNGGYSRLSRNLNGFTINGYSRIINHPEQQSINGYSRAIRQPELQEISMGQLAVYHSDDGGIEVESLQGFTLQGEWMTEAEYDLFIEATEAGDEDAMMQGLKKWFKRIKERRAEKRALKSAKKSAKIEKIYAKADAIRSGGTFGQNIAGVVGKLVNSVTGQVMDTEVGEIVGNVPVTYDELVGEGVIDKRPWYKQKPKNWSTQTKVVVGVTTVAVVGGTIWGINRAMKKRKKKR